MRYTRGMVVSDAPGKKILIVDDDAALRSMTRRILVRAGFNADEAGDGGEALEKFGADPSAYACVLLDFGLPDMDGEAVLAELRTIDPGARVIMSTGNDDVEEMKRLCGLGAEAFVQKPYSLEDLVDLIKRALEG